ncbi:MAG: hypothetical protein R3F59_20215 [Myxococcota bacterium]
MLWLAGVAAAAEPDVWLGGKLITGIEHQSDQGLVLGASEAELDVRVDGGWVAARADLDLHLASAPLPDGPWAVTAWPPEVAFLRLGDAGPGSPDVRLGVVSPELGVEAWDRDANDFASFSLGWNLLDGQVLGVEPGVWVGPDTRLFAFGGQDLLFGAPQVGAGVSGAVGDALSTWTGGFWMPTERYWLLVSGNQLALDDTVWLTAQVDVGDAELHPMVGGLVGLTLDLAPFGAAIRFEHQSVDRGFLAARYATVLPFTTAMTAALRLWHRDTVGVVLEGRERLLRRAAGPRFDVMLTVAVHRAGEPLRADVAR